MKGYTFMLLFISLATVRSFALSDGRCESIQVPLCKDLVYNMTSLPNMFRYNTQEEAGLELHQFFPLVKVQCSPDLRLFLCSVYLPVCRGTPNNEERLPPCRSLCESAKSGCGSLMRKFGFEWPKRLNCDRFLSNGSACVGRNSQTAEIGMTQTTHAVPVPTPTRKSRTEYTVRGMSPKQQLVNMLLSQYETVGSRNVIPEPEDGGPLNVMIGVQPIRLISLSNDALTFNAFDTKIWRDHRLSWQHETEDKTSITSLIMPADALWTPDIEYYRGVETPKDLLQHNNAYVDINGTVTLITFKQLTMPCKWMESWTYNCTIKVGSWMYLSSQMYVTPVSDTVDLQYVPESRWTITSTYVERIVKVNVECPEPCKYVLYTLTLKRN